MLRDKVKAGQRVMAADDGNFDASVAAAERKERLKALRAAVELSTADEEEEEEQEEEARHLKDDDTSHTTYQNGLTSQDQEGKQQVKFRNYLPRDEELQKSKKKPPELPKFDDPIAKDSSEITSTEDPFVSIAPKKANWDLRRDVAKKLEKLDRRTQRAIIELMQDEEKRRQALTEGGE